MISCVPWMFACSYVRWASAFDSVRDLLLLLLMELRDEAKMWWDEMRAWLKSGQFVIININSKNISNNNQEKVRYCFFLLLAPST